MRCRMRGHRGFKVFAILAVLASGLGLTSCRNKSPEARVDMISEKIADKLDFNTSQKGLLSDITTELKTDIESEKQYRLSIKDEVQKMILAPDLDKVRIKQLLSERQKRMEVKIDKYIASVSALHKSLTPEQKQEIVEKINMFTKHLE